MKENKKKVDRNWGKYIKEEVDWWKGIKDKQFVAYQIHTDFFEMIYEQYMRTIHQGRFKRSLEIGIGASGGFISIIRGTDKLYALDPLVDELKEMLPFSQKIQYKNGVAEKIPWGENAFELVVIANAIDHCEDMEKVMEEIKRVLKPEGLLVFFTFLKVQNPHPWTFNTTEEVKKLIKMEPVEEHAIYESNKFRKRNPYYIGIFKNEK